MTLPKLPELRHDTPKPAAKLNFASWPAICKGMPAESCSWLGKTVWPGLASSNMNKWQLAGKPGIFPYSSA